MIENIVVMTLTTLVWIDEILLLQIFSQKKNIHWKKRIEIIEKSFLQYFAKQSIETLSYLQTKEQGHEKLFL
jgi:hypothetical protein